MCVDTKGYDWERPAMPSDCAVLAEHFPNIDFNGLWGFSSNRSVILF
jgi:hypothetical protein